MKTAKMKEERINASDKAAKYPGNSIDLHDYHAWCVDKNGDVCNYSNETLMKSVEHPSLEVIHRPFTAHIIPKWLIICKDQYNIYIQNMANANCGGDIDVMIAQLTIILMVNPSYFLDQCCYPCAKLLHHYNSQKKITHDRFFGIQTGRWYHSLGIRVTVKVIVVLAYCHIG
jgi:hypothetical protein